MQCEPNTVELLGGDLVPIYHHKTWKHPIMPNKISIQQEQGASDTYNHKHQRQINEIRRFVKEGGEKEYKNWNNRYLNNNNNSFQFRALATITGQTVMLPLAKRNINGRQATIASLFLFSVPIRWMTSMIHQSYSKWDWIQWTLKSWRIIN